MGDSEAKAFLYLYPALSAVESQIDETVKAINVWCDLAENVPFTALDSRKARELLLASIVAFDVPKPDRLLQIEMVSQNSKRSGILRYYYRRALIAAIACIARLEDRLTQPELLELVSGPWDGIQRELKLLRTAMFSPHRSTRVSRAKAIVELLDHETFMIFDLGEAALSDWGYWILTSNESVPWYCYSEECRNAAKFVPRVISLLYERSATGDKTKRKPYKRGQHLKWQEMRAQLSLSYAQIAKRHESDTGVKVTPDAVAKALRRLQSEDISQMSLDN